MSGPQQILVVPERQTSCWDTWPSTYNAAQWKAMADRGETKRMYQILKYNQIGLTIVVWIHFFIHALWCLATRVPGFNLYDGSAAGNANTHSGWWLLMDLIVLAMGLSAPYFTLNYSRENQEERIETGIERTVDWLNAYAILAGLALLVNIAHAVLTLLELVSCTDTLCTQNHWCHIALIVFLFLLCGLFLWGLLRARTYAINLNRALSHGGLKPAIYVSNVTAGDQENPYQGLPSTPGPYGPEASAPSLLNPEDKEATGPDQLKRQLMTPLLQARYNQNPNAGRKFRHMPAGRGLGGMK